METHRITPARVRSATLLMLAAALCAGLARAEEPATQLYRLGGQSTYQQGCFPPCLCPILSGGPVTGTFELGLTDQGSEFDTYSVSNILWKLPPSGIVPQMATGSGVYRLSKDSLQTQQMTLDLSLDGEPPQAFDSGLVPGGGAFPMIHVTVSQNGMQCFDTVFDIHAEPVPPPPALPVRTSFITDPNQSHVGFSLFAGGTGSVLNGAVRLYLGDPDVAVIALPGMVGLSVDSVDLIAVDLQPDSPALPEPLHMILDPQQPSIGSWNTLTGEIQFALYLTSTDGGIPVPQPVQMSGTLQNGVLNISGNNGDIPDGSMSVAITAFDRLLPPGQSLWFSTSTGFTSGVSDSPSSAPAVVTSGDLLSHDGNIVRTNAELVGNLGIMPIVPPLGLDAVMAGPRDAIWFSFEEQNGPIWSETLNRWLSPGDLLSDEGRVVRSNARLLKPFAPSAATDDAGLDAVARADGQGLLFSTAQGFFSTALGRPVGHGDLLSHRGELVLTNRELLQRFDVVDISASPLPPDYGLDALALRPFNEIWFSTSQGFYVRDRMNPGQTVWISDGDLLSNFGYVVARNLDLVAPFAPLEDAANFGLDALHITPGAAPAPRIEDAAP